MNTEQKIREAFEAYSLYSDEELEVPYNDFRAGYLALLNSLETLGTYTDKHGITHAISFRLPEGVTKQ